MIHISPEFGDLQNSEFVVTADSWTRAGGSKVGTSEVQTENCMPCWTSSTSIHHESRVKAYVVFVDPICAPTNRASLLSSPRHDWLRGSTSCPSKSYQYDVMSCEFPVKARKLPRAAKGECSDFLPDLDDSL
eukprot:1182274-Prorocentrum_minimum.AAC.3